MIGVTLDDSHSKEEAGLREDSIPQQDIQHYAQSVLVYTRQAQALNTGTQSHCNKNATVLYFLPSHSYVIPCELPTEK